MTWLVKLLVSAALLVFVEPFGATERDNDGVSALLLAGRRAAEGGDAALLQWLVSEGGASIEERFNNDDSAANGEYVTESRRSLNAGYLEDTLADEGIQQGSMLVQNEAWGLIGGALIPAKEDPVAAKKARLARFQSTLDLEKTAAKRANRAWVKSKAVYAKGALKGHVAGVAGGFLGSVVGNEVAGEEGSKWGGHVGSTVAAMVVGGATSGPVGIAAALVSSGAMIAAQELLMPATEALVEELMGPGLNAIFMEIQNNNEDSARNLERDSNTAKYLNEFGCDPNGSQYDNGFCSKDRCYPGKKRFPSNSWRQCCSKGHHGRCNKVVPLVLPLKRAYMIQPRFDPGANWNQNAVDMPQESTYQPCQDELLVEYPYSLDDDFIIYSRILPLSYVPYSNLGFYFRDSEGKSTMDTWDSAAGAMITENRAFLRAFNFANAATCEVGPRHQKQTSSSTYAWGLEGNIGPDSRGNILTTSAGETLPPVHEFDMYMERLSREMVHDIQEKRYASPRDKDEALFAAQKTHGFDFMLARIDGKLNVYGKPVIGTNGYYLLGENLDLTTPFDGFGWRPSSAQVAIMSMQVDPLPTKNYQILNQWPKCIPDCVNYNPAASSTNVFTAKKGLWYQVAPFNRCFVAIAEGGSTNVEIGGSTTFDNKRFFLERPCGSFIKGIDLSFLSVFG